MERHFEAEKGIWWQSINAGKFLTWYRNEQTFQVYTTRTCVKKTIQNNPIDERSVCFFTSRSTVVHSYLSLTASSIIPVMAQVQRIVGRNWQAYPLLFSVPGHVAVVTSTETSRASITKGRYPKSATPITNRITINVAITHLAQQQLGKQREYRIAKIRTLATCACMLYKQTSASFQVTAGCVVSVVQGTKMKMNSYL